MTACGKLQWLYCFCINSHICMCTHTYVCMYITYTHTHKKKKVPKFRHSCLYINVCLYIQYTNILHCFIFDFIHLLHKLAIKFGILKRKAQPLWKKVILYFEVVIPEVSHSVQIENMSTKKNSNNKTTLSNKRLFLFQQSVRYNEFWSSPSLFNFRKQ